MTTQDLIDAIKTRYDYESRDAHAFAVGYLWAELTEQQQEKILENLSKTPCNVCETPIKTDIHKEELGMCVDCSNKYFDHKDEK
jgi:hypothetical protein